jgi:LPXTG-site transpeptidase (sortase) family protein
VEMVRRILTHSMIYEIIGRLMISMGIMLGLFLGIRLTREVMDDSITQQSPYLLIANTPAFEFPPATPLPTPTPTPLPTATPLPLPAIRLSIPVINLNTSINEIFPIEISGNSEIKFVWEPPMFAVGHFDSSGNPGGGDNIVLFGHNNTQGEVFRYLDSLVIGDKLILFTEEKEFHYRVQKKFIIPYLGSEEQGDATLQSYSAPQTTEVVTMISCWPYATNSHRIVIIAVPSSDGDENGQ